jgi:CBS domain-containing protein
MEVRTMKCREIMKSDVAFVHESERAWAAAALMRDRNVGFLPVCDQAGRVIGTLTDRDLAIRIVADGISSDRNVGEIMTPEVVCCSPDDDVERAAELMEGHHKGRIMCVDNDGRVVGVISFADVEDVEDIEVGAILIEEATP